MRIVPVTPLPPTGPTAKTPTRGCAGAGDGGGATTGGVGMTIVGWAVGVAVGDGSFAEGIEVGTAVSLEVAAGDEVGEARSPAATTEAHALRLNINATPITSRRT